MGDMAAGARPSRPWPSRPWPAVVGPTGSGKTDLAVQIAQRFGWEVVSCDSMLVYRGMDVGTAKPTRRQMNGVTHHLMDLAEPEEPFSVARFQACGHEVLEDMAARGARPLIVGGSGLYFRALVDDLVFPGTDPDTRAELEAESLAGIERLYERLTHLDPDAAAKIEPGNIRRTVRALEVPAITGELFSSFAEAWDSYPGESTRAAGINIPREILGTSIAARIDGMLAAGFLEEVRGLLQRGLGGWLTSSQAIGYAEMARHLQGELSLEEAVVGTVKRTKALARRQDAWFRRDPRIRWFDCQDPADVADAIADHLGET